MNGMSLWTKTGGVRWGRQLHREVRYCLLIRVCGSEKGELHCDVWRTCLACNITQCLRNRMFISLSLPSSRPFLSSSHPSLLFQASFRGSPVALVMCAAGGGRVTLIPWPAQESTLPRFAQRENNKELSVAAAPGLSAPTRTSPVTACCSLLPMDSLSLTHSLYVPPLSLTDSPPTT